MALEIEVLKNPELHPDRYGGDNVYETKKVAEHWHSEDMYRGWLVITIEKYCSRYGKKDDRLKEAYKIYNYAKFLVEFETRVANGENPKEVYDQVNDKLEKTSKRSKWPTSGDGLFFEHGHHGESTFQEDD